MTRGQQGASQPTVGPEAAAPVLVGLLLRVVAGSSQREDGRIQQAAELPYQALLPGALGSALGGSGHFSLLVPWVPNREEPPHRSSWVW